MAPGVLGSEARDQYVPSLQVIVCRSLETVPVICLPPQAALTVLGSVKVPVAVAPCSLVSDTELPL